MKKNPHARALGKLGGKARIDALSQQQLDAQMAELRKARQHKVSPVRRSEIARMAAQARYKKRP